MGDVKSLQGTHRVKATFKNKSERTVDVYWKDYRGKLVLYMRNLKPGQEMLMNTFVTHPWTARDSETGHWLHLNGKSEYVTPMPEGGPQHEEDEQIEHPVFVGSVEINIHIPVYSLEDIVVGFLRKQLKQRSLTEDQLNRYLLNKVSNIPSISARVYQYQQDGGITDD